MDPHRPFRRSAATLSPRSTQDVVPVDGPNGYGRLLDARSALCDRLGHGWTHQLCEVSVAEEGIQIKYRLPVTVVRFGGQVTTTTDALLGRQGQTTTRTGTAVVEVRPDPRGERTLMLPESRQDKMKLTLKLLADGRLAGAESSFDSQAGERLSAVLSAATATASALLPFAAGAGALGTAVTAAGAMAAAAAAGIAVQAGSEEAHKALHKGIETGAQADSHGTDHAITPEKVGIHPKFERDHPAEYEALYRYRRALLLTSFAHAEAAGRAHRDPEGAVSILRNLDRALRSIRGEAARVEEVYALWRRSQCTSETAQVNVQLYIDQIPTTSRFLEEVQDRPAHHDDADPWWPIATKLRLMVTCDLLSGKEPSQRSVHLPVGTVAYRQPQPARLTTWKLFRHDEAPSGWRADEERTEWALVSHRDATYAVRLAVPSGADEVLNVGFDETGGLTSFAADVTGAGAQRAQTIAGLPATLKDAAAAGAGLAASLSPATARISALKQQIDEAESRAKLQGLLNPTTDDLAELRKQLTEAELQARLALAQRIAQDPSTVIVTTSSLEESG